MNEYNTLVWSHHDTFGIECPSWSWLELSFFRSPGVELSLSSLVHHRLGGDLDLDLLSGGLKMWNLALFRGKEMCHFLTGKKGEYTSKDLIQTKGNNF